MEMFNGLFSAMEIIALSFVGVVILTLVVIILVDFYKENFNNDIDEEMQVIASTVACNDSITFIGEDNILKAIQFSQMRSIEPYKDLIPYYLQASNDEKENLLLVFSSVLINSHADGELVEFEHARVN